MTVVTVMSRALVGVHKRAQQDTEFGSIFLREPQMTKKATVKNNRSLSDVNCDRRVESVEPAVVKMGGGPVSSESDAVVLQLFLHALALVVCLIVRHGFV